MKLCRFELLEEPGTARSGIFHDSRVYETHGMRAIGIHDLTKVRFLAPIPRPASIRLFDSGPNGLSFQYLNPSALVAAGSDVGAPPTGEYGFEVRIGIVAQEGGECLGDEEAEMLILGLVPVVCLRSEVADPVSARDVPIAAGPFLVTDEDLPSPLAMTVSIERNGHHLSRIEGVSLPVPPGALMARASRGLGLASGDLVLSPPLAQLKGTLALGQELSVAVEPLGAVRLRS